MSDTLFWILGFFAVFGALDRIFGNQYGLGREFENGLESILKFSAQTVLIAEDPIQSPKYRKEAQDPEQGIRHDSSPDPEWQPLLHPPEHPYSIWQRWCR